MSQFIDDSRIKELLIEAKGASTADIRSIIEKARDAKGLSLEEVAKLLTCEDEATNQELFRVAREIKEKIYGKRIVLFAPLYASSYCVNNCYYCGYKHTNEIPRRKLTRDEIRQEIDHVAELGHKRIALEVGEDPVNCPIDYVVDTMKTIYETGKIRRINVNVAATTVENYRKLKAADIGTYILFQETYHKETYEKLHPNGPKSNYDYHTTAMDRAMEGGIDDVGIGVLFGLYDYRYEVLGMLMHAQHLEKVFGVGPHTVSVPRLRPAIDVTLKEYPHLVDDDSFKRLVAILRLAIPYTGMILSTREPAELRDEILALGISQVSAGSCTGVGGYSNSEDKPQFEVGDHRTPMEILKSLVKSGYIPSYCTACYRQGRTGDRFMDLAKSGQICNVCLPNALMTFKEFILDYGDEELTKLSETMIQSNLASIGDPQTREKTQDQLRRLENGTRDLYF